MTGQKKNGFTLIEIVVSATVIAVLTATAIVGFTQISRKSRDSKRRSDLEQMRSALEQYRADNGYYPNACGGSVVQITSGSCLGSGVLVSTYISALPSDPKSNPYRFQATNASGGNYYGYCLVAYTEQDFSADNTCTDGSTPPSGYFLYGVKSP